MLLEKVERSGCDKNNLSVAKSERSVIKKRGTMLKTQNKCIEELYFVIVLKIMRDKILPVWFCPTPHFLSS